MTPVKDWAQSSMNNMNFNEAEILEILGKVYQYGNVDHVMSQLNA